MSRTHFRNLALAAALLAGLALPAAAQSFVVDEVTTFRAPTRMSSAIVKLPDGRIYGFYSGGFNGGIYQSVPDGSGGYTTQIAYEFSATDPGLPGSFQLNAQATESVEVGADGRIYFAASGGLARFDPNTNTLELLHAFTNLNPVSLTMGIDGATVFGGGSAGALFSYNTLTGEYRDIGNAGNFLVTVVQMKDGNLLVMNYEYVTPRVVYRKVDPATGVELAAVIHEPASAVAPVRGDDGEVYALSNIFGDKTVFRVDPGCFCFNGLMTWLYPSPFMYSLTGSHAGSLYFQADGRVQRLNLTATPPIVETVLNRNLFYLQMMADGTLMMFDGSGAWGLNTATLSPGVDTSYLVAQQVAVDGVDGLPTDVTEGADGLLYGIAGETRTRFASIFRIDPVARTHALVQRLDLGIEPAANGYGTTLTKMVLGPDGKLYGGFTSYDTSDSAVFSYDPATNAAAIVRAFPVDPATSYPGTDGGFPDSLVFGSDGWIYGQLAFGGDINTYSGALFKLDPNSGTLVKLYTQENGFYLSAPMIETAPGLWLGSYQDYGNYCGNLFRLDANTATLTTIKTFDYDADGCPSSMVMAPGGTVFITASAGGTGGGGGIYSFNPATNAVTLLKTFDYASGTQRPQGLWIGADGEVYGYMGQVNGISKPAVFRFNRATNQPVFVADLTGAAGYYVGPFLRGRDGRAYAVTQVPTVVLAVGFIESIPVAPASGPFGGTTTVSATLKAMGVPLAGQTITFTLNGHAIGSATTGVDGVATLNNVSIAGIAIGTHASAIGASFAGDDRFPAASGSAALTVIDVPTPGLMIGNGYIRNDDAKYEFGFIVHERANGVDRGGFALTISQAPPSLKLRRGRLEKPRDDRFVARSFTNVVFSDDPSIRPGRRQRPQVDTVLFAGDGEWNGEPGYRFEAFAQDRGEPGRRHQEALRVTIYNAAGAIVATVDGNLDGGNVQSLRLRR